MEMETIAKQLNHDFKKGSLELYDSNGNEIYFENSNGYWYKREYDSNGNIIYYENLEGYWYKHEYDTNGDEIYYEDSEGDIQDNRPKAKCNGKTVVIDGIKYELTEKK